MAVRREWDDATHRLTYTGRGKAYRIINHVLEWEAKFYMANTSILTLTESDGDPVLSLKQST